MIFHTSKKPLKFDTSDFSKKKIQNKWLARSDGDYLYQFFFFCFRDIFIPMEKYKQKDMFFITAWQT